jgi:hypothetical protein
VVARASASDIVEQVANELDHELLISHPVVEDPTDSKGLPFAAPTASRRASCRSVTSSARCRRASGR